MPLAAGQAIDPAPFFDVLPTAATLGRNWPNIYARRSMHSTAVLSKASADLSRDGGFAWRDKPYWAARSVVGFTSCRTLLCTGLSPTLVGGQALQSDLPARWASNETTRDIVQQALLGEPTFETDDVRKGFAGRA